MASKRLRRLKLPPELLQATEREGLSTCRDVLIHNRVELLHILDVNIEQVDLLMNTICEAIAPRVSTAQEMMQQAATETNHLPTGLPVLDQLLRGGVPVGTITEFTGPAGAGKTQFSIMMSVISAERGGAVIYIDTEGSFHAKRLKEIAVARDPSLGGEHSRLSNITSRVHLMRVRTAAELLDRLGDLENLVIEYDAKFVVIDSIAARPGRSLALTSCHNAKTCSPRKRPCSRMWPRLCRYRSWSQTR